MGMMAFEPMRLCAFSSSEAARLMSRDSWSRESATVPAKFFEGPIYNTIEPEDLLSWFYVGTDPAGFSGQGSVLTPDY